VSPARERSFVIENGDGRAEDIAAKTLARLRRGDPEPEEDVDLHGLDARSAAREVRRAVQDARARGVRCIQIIHGRGLHSESGAV
jgi:DNA-nicking Smr family endonuclease